MTYHAALFVHLLAVYVSFVGAGIDYVAVRRLRSARSLDGVLAWSWLCDPIETSHKLAGPLILLSGLLMEGVQWGWQQAWINVSIVALVAISVSGATLGGPRFAAIHRLAKEQRAADPLAETLSPALTAALADPFQLRVTATLAGTALGVTWLMAAKPGLLASVAIVLFGAVAGYATQLLAERPKPNTAAEEPQQALEA